MNRVKLTISDESGKTLCKIGTSIPFPEDDYEYTDLEIAAALLEMARSLQDSANHRSYLTGRWSGVLDGPTADKIRKQC